MITQTYFEELLERKKRGSLKIYLGYAAGTGKTYAMLQEAHQLLKRKLDVVIGYIQPHARPETVALTHGLEQIPMANISIAGSLFPELDVSAILKRNPQIVLIDELAHTHVNGLKNKKRHEDVEEILAAKINVISTLNVQHLESVADRIESVTKVFVKERLPDSILTHADQVVIVDVSIEELRERLRLGKIYESKKAEIALQHFFTYENLSLLREISLREAAGYQIKKIQEQALLTKKASDVAEEAVMVAMSSDPTHADVLIRKAIRIANQLSTRCYAVYIQSTKELPHRMPSSMQRKIQQNLKVAKSLGAEIVMLQSDHIAETLLTFACAHHIKHAIFGKSRSSLFMERLKGSIVLEFIHDSVGVDIHIVSL